MMSGWRRCFQEARYRTIVKIARLVRRYRTTGDSPVFRPVLVGADQPATALSLSPHPDDDILAVGGALAGHEQAGGSVHSVILTDGLRGTPNAEPDPASVEIRRNEALAAAQILGLKTPEFWSLPDGRLKAGEPIVRKLSERISAIQPDMIYVPFPVDYHPDHLAASRLLVRALQLIHQEITVRCYECVIPLLPNLIIDITSLADLKRSAVACFKSQNEVTDYVYTIVEGLNRLRTHGLMKGKGYAEAVFETRPAFLEQLLDEMES